jgi:hypothetical protein
MSKEKYKPTKEWTGESMELPCPHRDDERINFVGQMQAEGWFLWNYYINIDGQLMAVFWRRKNEQRST